MGRVPTPLSCSGLTRTATTPSSAYKSTSSTQQIRHATFIHRPRRPYTFTQLVALSDGSTYTVRTTSPLPIYRATKDTRNTLTWQPSEKSLKNVEVDEAGRLAAFRERFGRAFDTQAAAAEEGGASAEAGTPAAQEEASDDYHDLITSYASPADEKALKGDAGYKKAPTKKKK